MKCLVTCSDDRIVKRFIFLNQFTNSWRIISKENETDQKQDNMKKDTYCNATDLFGLQTRVWKDFWKKMGFNWYFLVVKMLQCVC